jgi:hypothetical protein
MLQWLYTYVASFHFQCYLFFRRMLQVWLSGCCICFHTYVASVLSGCCICFHTYVVSVLSGCCVFFQWFLSVFMRFCKCFRYMFQVFYLPLDISNAAYRCFKSISVLHMLQLDPPSLATNCSCWGVAEQVQMAKGARAVPHASDARAARAPRGRVKRRRVGGVLPRVRSAGACRKQSELRASGCTRLSRRPSSSIAVAENISNI